MKLNHVNIASNDVAATHAFLAKDFGFRLVADRGADTLVIMSDDAGSITAVSNSDKTDKVVYPAGFHVGFFVDSDARVDAIFERLSAAGHALEPRQHAHGAWTFYFKAPGDFTVEVAHQPGVNERT